MKDNLHSNKIKMEFTDEEFIKPSVQLTEEQNFAFEKFKDGENIFITGPGGTGKSLFIQNIVKYAKSESKNIQVCN